MSGVNQVTFTDKVNTRTLPIPAINKGRDVDFNELKSKHNALDSQMTDPATGLVALVNNIDTDLGTAETNISNLETSKEATANKAVDFAVVDNVKFPTTQAVDSKIDSELALFPINNEIQLDSIDGVATIIQLGLNPTGSIINFQTPENEFGSIAEPLTDLTISLVLARKNKVTAYVEKTSIPTRIDPLTNTDIVWLGDAYNGTVGFVNKMVMKHQTAPTPQNRIIEITNTVVDMTDFGVDTDLKIYLQFDEAPGNEVNFIDSSGYGNNFQAVSGMSTGELPTLVTDPANTPLRATRGGRQGVLWNHITSGNNGAFVGAYAPFIENLVAFLGFTVMFEFEGTSAIVGNTAGLASFCHKTGFGFRIQKSGVDGGTHDNKFEFRINANTSSAQRIRSTSAYTSDTRIHLAFTYENGIGLSLYINGVLNSSSTDTLGTIQIDETVNPAFYLGTRQENLTLTGSSPKNGTFMNEFKYLTRRLLLAEIQTEATRLGYL